MFSLSRQMPAAINEVYESFSKYVNGCSFVLFVVEFDPESNLLLDDYNFEMFMRLQSLRKQVRIRNLKFRNLQILSLINATLVRMISSLRAGSPKSPELTTTEFGKPSLEDRSFTFNISDEFNMVAIVVDFGSRGEVGLDLADMVEMRPLVPDVSTGWTSPTEEIFSKRENLFLQQQYGLWTPEERQTNLQTLLTQYWSLKEGYTKFLGLGLNYPLVNCEFEQALSISLPHSAENPSYYFTELKRDWVPAKCLSTPKTTSFTTRLSHRIFCSVHVDAKVVYGSPKLISISLESMLAFCNSVQE